MGLEGARIPLFIFGPEAKLALGKPFMAKPKSLAVIRKHLESLGGSIAEDEYSA